jgi:hypothetical protein
MTANIQKIPKEELPNENWSYGLLIPKNAIDWNKPEVKPNYSATGNEQVLSQGKAIVAYTERGMRRYGTEFSHIFDWNSDSGGIDGKELYIGRVSVKEGTSWLTTREAKKFYLRHILL